jgi:hypothetical protein
MSKFSNQLKISRPVVMLSCLGLLVSGLMAFTGCNGTSSKQEEKKGPPILMSVEQIDQLAALDEKVPDGQYLVTKVAFHNNSNNSIVLQSGDFVLENITENEKERYSQPAERGMSSAFAKVYGKALKGKVMDFESANLYPRMEIERYFVFMVPSDAAVNGYQITYKPAKISTPLVTSEATVINDNRNQQVLPNEQQQSAEPSRP